MSPSASTNSPGAYGEKERIHPWSSWRAKTWEWFQECSHLSSPVLLQPPLWVLSSKVLRALPPITCCPSTTAVVSHTPTQCCPSARIPGGRNQQPQRKLREDCNMAVVMLPNLPYPPTACTSGASKIRGSIYSLSPLPTLHPHFFPPPLTYSFSVCMKVAEVPEWVFAVFMFCICALKCILNKKMSKYHSNIPPKKS